MFKYLSTAASLNNQTSKKQIKIDGKGIHNWQFNTIILEMLQ